MPKLNKPAPACRACGGTGRNSRGGACAPCVANGRVAVVHVNTRGCRKPMTPVTAAALGRALLAVRKQFDKPKE